MLAGGTIAAAGNLQNSTVVAPEDHASYHFTSVVCRVRILISLRTPLFQETLAGGSLTFVSLAPGSNTR